MRVHRPPGLSRVGDCAILLQVFGALAAYLLLRTGSLAAPVAAHIFCNMQGVPDFGRILSHGSFMRAALGAGIALFAAAIATLEATSKGKRA